MHLLCNLEVLLALCSCLTRVLRLRGCLPEECDAGHFP